MRELSAQIRGHLEDSSFIDEAFPAIRKWGLRDEDVFVHSLGCSLWNTLGHELGYMAVVETPAPIAVGSDIRSDSAWFRRDTGTPAVLVEFERYDGSTRSKEKLDRKLLNLAVAASRWDAQPELLVLSAWSVGVVSAPDFAAMSQKLRSLAHNPRAGLMSDIRGKSLLFCRFIFEKDVSGLLRLEHLNFWEEL